MFTLYDVIALSIVVVGILIAAWIIRARRIKAVIRGKEMSFHVEVTGNTSKR